MGLEISQVIIQMIAFLIMLLVLKKFGWKPLLDVLHERQQKIQSEFDSIAEQKDDVKKLAKDYQEKLREIDVEARHKIQEAIAQGQKIARDIQEEAKTNARETLAKARHEVHEEIAKVRNQLKNELVSLTMAIAEKILHTKLDASEHQKLITEFAEEVDWK